MLRKFYDDERGSSAVEAAVVLVPVMMLVFLFIIYFNKTTLEAETTYAMKEGIRAAVTQSTYEEAKDAAVEAFTEALTLNTNSKTRLRDDNLNGTPNIYFNIYNLDGTKVTGEDKWCRDYVLEMTVKVERKSPIIVQNTLLDEFGEEGSDTRRTINDSLMLDKQISTKIENAKICE